MEGRAVLFHCDGILLIHCDSYKTSDEEMPPPDKCNGQGPAAVEWKQA